MLEWIVLNRRWLYHFVRLSTFLCYFISVSPAQADLQDNCPLQYEPLELPIFFEEIAKSLRASSQSEVRALQEKVDKAFISELKKNQPEWHGSRLADLGKRIQKYLYEHAGQKAPDLDSLRLYWHLILIAQKQWDVLAGSLIKTKDSAFAWQRAEVAFAKRNYPRAINGFKKKHQSSPGGWLSFRLLEAYFLQGDISSTFKLLMENPSQDLLENSRVRSHFHQLVQALARRTGKVSSLLKVIEKRNDDEAIQQVAFCVLSDERLFASHRDTLEALLRTQKATPQSLRTALRAIKADDKKPPSLEIQIKLLGLMVQHAKNRFAIPGSDRGVDAYRVSQSLSTWGEKIMALGASNYVQHEKQVDALFQLAITVLEPHADTRPLSILRARLQEALSHHQEAAEIYKQLGNSAKDPQERKKYADLMFRNFTLTLSEAKNKDGLNSMCESYKKLNLGQSTASKKCDMWMAEAALLRKDTATAGRIFWHVIHEDPSSNEAALAARSLLKMLRRQPAELLKTTEELLNIPFFQSGPWGSELSDLKRQSSFEQISLLSSNDDQAQAYFTFSQKEKDHPLARRSLLRAVSLDQTRGRLDSAMDRLALWLQTYPHEPNSPTQKMRLIEMADGSLQISRLKTYMRLAPTQELSEEQKEQIVYNTCTYDTLDEPIKAMTSCDLVRRQASEIALLKINVAHALAQSEEAQALYDYAKNRILSPSDFTVAQKIQVFSRLYRLDGLTPLQKDETKNILFNLYLEHHDQLDPASRSILASLAYEEAHKKLPQYLAIPIYGTQPDELVAAIQGKKQAFDDLEGLYSKVLQTKDPSFGSRSLCDLGLAAENFADVMEQMPEVTGIDIKDLMLKISGQIANQKAKAKNFIFQARTTLEKYQVFHQENRRIFNEAERLRQDLIQFDDWIPFSLDQKSLTVKKLSAQSWAPIESQLLQSSALPVNQGKPAIASLRQAFEDVLDQGDILRAQWLVNRIKNHPHPSAKVLGAMCEGRLKGREKDWLAMEAALKQALTIDGQHTEAKILLGTLYAYFGFFDQAYPYLKDLEDNPQVLPILIAVERHIDLKEKADQHCTTLLAGGPKLDTIGLFNCALLEGQNHSNWSRALEWMKQVVSHEPSQSLLKIAAEKQIHHICKIVSC